MEPYLHLDGIKSHDNKEDVLEHLKMVLEQLEGMFNNLGYTVTFLNENHDNLIEEIEKKHDVSFAQGHIELDNFLQAIYKEIEENENNKETMADLEHNDRLNEANQAYN